MNGISLIDDYIKWYKDNTLIRNLDKSVELTTPFLNHLNDRIRIHVEKIETEKLILDDDGETLNELALFGLDISSKTRQRLFDQVMRNYGVKVKNDVLFVEATAKNFPEKKHKLLEAIIRIYDLTLTKRETVQNLFNDEVQDFLFENDFGGFANVGITGNSSIIHQVDYVLGRTKNRKDTYIQFSNNLTYGNFAIIDFMFDDIKRMQPSVETRMIIVANDQNSIEKKAVHGIESQEIELIPWSDKELILNIKNAS